MGDPFKNYVTIEEGIYKGVAYQIKNIEFVEKDGGHFLAFDYDVKGLTEGREKEFEDFIGNFLMKAVEDGIARDKQNDGNGA